MREEACEHCIYGNRAHTIHRLSPYSGEKRKYCICKECYKRVINLEKLRKCKVGDETKLGGRLPWPMPPEPPLTPPTPLPPFPEQFKAAAASNNYRRSDATPKNWKRRGSLPEGTVTVLNANEVTATPPNEIKDRPSMPNDHYVGGTHRGAGLREMTKRYALALGYSAAEAGAPSYHGLYDPFEEERYGGW